MHTQRRYATRFGVFKIKHAYPKKVCHMPTRHVKKREREKKREEKKDSPYPKKKKKKKQERDGSYKEFIHHPPKIHISTHLHILIKVYDLFLLWIRFLT